MLLDQLAYTFESSDVAVFLTLLLLEGVLSFDNAAVIAAMVRRLPPDRRRKALLYGLAGAYTFRVAAILLAGVLIDNPWLRIVGGTYLLYLMGRHLLSRRPHERAVPMAATVGIGAFWGTVARVEMADLVFALDQIVVAVALTEKILLIVAAAVFAILALRLSALYMIRLMEWFPALETLAYLAVGWVGLKLLLAELVGIHVPKPIGIGVTMVLLVLPVLAKATYDWMRRPAPADASR